MAPDARSAFGRPRRLAGAQSALAAGLLSGAFGVVIGATPDDVPCCQSAAAQPIGRDGRPGRARTLTTALDGATTAELVPLARGRAVIGLAGQSGVWLAASTGAAASVAGPAGTASVPATRAFAATGLGGNRWAAAWTVAGRGGAADIVVALGRGTAVAGARRRVFLRVPSGDSIDELAIAPRAASGATVAWTESWYDPAGRWHSRLYAADLAAVTHPVALSSPALLAAGPALSGDRSRGAIAVWEECDPARTTCRAEAATRVHTRWQPAQRLGRADAGEAVDVVSTAGGTAIAGWISGGRIRVALAGRGDRRFGHSRTLSRGGGSASQLALTAGPRGGALAAWTEGTGTVAVGAARYGGP